MRVLMFGGRHWNAQGPIQKEVLRLKAKYKGELFIFAGGAPGADCLVRKVCRRAGVAFAEFSACWEYYGFAAGPVRNGWMFKFGMPDTAVCFHSDLEHSKGSKDMYNLLQKHEVHVRVITKEGSNA